MEVSMCHPQVKVANTVDFLESGSQNLANQVQTNNIIWLI